MYMTASRRSVLILEFAHLWGRIMDMTPTDAARSDEKFRFDLFEQQNPAEAAAAKKLQAQAFDAALNL